MSRVVELVLDPTVCAAHGLCAALFPERITLDDWGYPIIGKGPIPASLMEHAKAAVTACPALALSLHKHRA